jgi:hypothetical protein
MRPGLVAGLIGVTSTGAIIALAHHSMYVQRNGAHGGYRWLALGWSVVLVSCLAVLTWNVGRLVRRLDYSRGQLRFLSVLARLLSASMFAIFVSFVVWWVAIAEYAKVFLATGLMGVANSSIPVPMVASATLMLVGLITASWGVHRSWRRLA